MANYFLVFGSGNPASNTGLAPTFIVFRNPAGGATTPPSITEVSTTGIYTFSYTAAGSIAFVADGATTGLATADRYITGSLDVGDANQAVDFGSSADAIGDSATSPTTLFGYIKRIREFLEGDSTYTKTSGVWLVKDRSGATTLASKTITDSGSVVTKD